MAKHTANFGKNSIWNLGGRCILQFWGVGSHRVSQVKFVNCVVKISPYSLLFSHQMSKEVRKRLHSECRVFL